MLVEERTENPYVSGSIPEAPIHGQVMELVDVQDLKSCVRKDVGVRSSP